MSPEVGKDFCTVGLEVNAGINTKFSKSGVIFYVEQYDGVTKQVASAPRTFTPSNMIRNLTYF
jgi:hypothetical protein